MESLANLESFARSAEAGSFSAAARGLGLTPAAVSRNVAQLERNLGVRLFQRSTRRLALTEAGERFLHAIAGNLAALQGAIADAAGDQDMPAGVLRVSMSAAFALDWMLPLLPGFTARYPAVRPDWRLENRQVDLIAEGYDAAIGGGFELPSGVVARALAPAHVIAVAAPAFLAGRRLPRVPDDLAGMAGIVMRSARTGRLRQWTMRDGRGHEQAAMPQETVVLNDMEALTRAALLGLGVTLVTLPHALRHLEEGTLVRLLPDWYVDEGAVSLYFPSRRLLPAKTRAFVDYVVASFEQQGLPQRFRADR